jgi:DNA polymerase III epsilon subunit-like protein
MLKQTNRMNNLGWEEGWAEFFCVMEMYKHFCSAYRWVRLEAAAQQCSIGMPNSHRAKDDALLARAVFEYMASFWS